MDDFDTNNNKYIRFIMCGCYTVHEIDYVNIHRKSIDNIENQITTSKWMKGSYNNMGQPFGMLKTFCMIIVDNC